MAGASVLLDRLSGLWMLCAIGGYGAAACSSTLGPWLHLPARPLALLLLAALSITSLPALQRRMGAAWQKLHNWVYAIALLVPVHYWWSLKSGWGEPLIYLLLAWALLWPRREKLLRPMRGRWNAKEA